MQVLHSKTKPRMRRFSWRLSSCLLIFLGRTAAADCSCSARHGQYHSGDLEDQNLFILREGAQSAVTLVIINLKMFKPRLKTVSVMMYQQKSDEYLLARDLFLDRIAASLAGTIRLRPLCAIVGYRNCAVDSAITTA